MNWDFSFENFKQHGPDEPNTLDFSAVFPTGAFVVDLPRDLLDQVIDKRSVSLKPSEIKKDVSRSKWKDLETYIGTGGPLTPPWAVASGNKELIFVAQGRHRFQWSFINGCDSIPVVVNEVLAQTLKQVHGLTARPMDA